MSQTLLESPVLITEFAGRRCPMVQINDPRTGAYVQLELGELDHILPTLATWVRETQRYLVEAESQRRARALAESIEDEE